MRFLVINGPNINMLGIREKNIYGMESYSTLRTFIFNSAKNLAIDCDEFQSNHEGVIVDKIQSAYKMYDGIIINPAAYTHTSIAIPDAIKAVSLPAIEVHISDIYLRESYRHISYTKDACIETITGHGFESYKIAMEKLKIYVEKSII